MFNRIQINCNSNKLDQTFSKNTSTENGHPEFQFFLNQKQKFSLNFKAEDLEE